MGQAVAHNEHGVRAVGGFAILIGFAACWLAIPMRGLTSSPRRFWPIYGLLVALMVAELPFAHAQAFVMAVFITAPRRDPGCRAPRVRPPAGAAG
ncbi:MAG: hypothetical protein ACRDRJ_11460 [Streptosporangiaceae bacterium]